MALARLITERFFEARANVSKNAALRAVVSQFFGAGPLGILTFPCFAVPHLPFGGSIGKVNDERVRVKPIGGRAGMRHGLVTRRKMSFRDHKISRVDIRRRRLGEVAHCQHHVPEDRLLSGGRRDRRQIRQNSN
jgi:hypothetical protein